MKRISLLILTFIALTAGAIAQRGLGAGPGGDRGPERFLMILPAETREAVIRLRAEHEIERTALVVKFREGALTYPQFIEQRDGMRDRHQAAIRAKLTPEQRAAFDEHVRLMEERRANRPGRGGPGRGGW
jgi:Spy/CpxP family protein refolding chaperone